jgi:hypothetical protein
MNTKERIDAIRKLAQELKTISDDEKQVGEPQKHLAFAIMEECRNYETAREQAKATDTGKFVHRDTTAKDLERRIAEKRRENQGGGQSQHDIRT